MASLKTKTARSLKWNIIDKVSTQVLYAITGIVLARELSQEDFGLVGAVLIFQAFASLLVDSGFSFTLLQRRRPSRLDYSTVLWFNLGVAAVLYVGVWFAAPLIADIFQGDRRLIPLTRAMFVALPLNAAAIVQANRLMKAMDVRMIAASNSLGLAVGGATGIALAISGFGAWAIVAQTIAIAAVKSLVLWTSSRWRPLARFSWTSLRSFFGLGSKMMLSSFLNTVFQNLYSFFIGNRVNLTALGYYSQSEKWSRMGTASLSQVLTSSFVPALSAVQNDPDRYRRLASKMTRFTAYLLFPAMLWLATVAKPLFHTLFGTKWDASVYLFQLLLFRGIFVVLNSLASNFLLGLGHGSDIVRQEILRDVLAVVALAVTFPYMTLSTAADPVAGVAIMLWGQVIATILTWLYTMAVTLRRLGSAPGTYVSDLAPYFCLTAITVPAMLGAAALVSAPYLKLAVEGAAALAIYIGINAALGSKVQKETFTYLRGAFAKNSSIKKA